MDFRARYSLEQRSAEASRIHDKFPGRIPCIVQKAKSSKTMPTIDKEKFLVPGDLTIGQFIFVIRKRIALDSDKALFVFVGNTLPTTGTLMRELFRAHAEDDGFLYLTYCGESTFGDKQGGGVGRKGVTDTIPAATNKCMDPCHKDPIVRFG